MENCIYFDNAATTYPKPEEVYETMDYVNRHGAVNAGRGSYALAREAATLISDTKKSILKLCKFYSFSLKEFLKFSTKPSMEYYFLISIK